jgi:lipopolysaccharide export system permease protein
MFRNPTLSLYFARRFARMTLIIFIVVFVLIAFIDYLELARRVSSDQGFSAFLYLLVSLARVPSVIERALPFTILFAAIASFVMANRQLELVVARASGVSAWQFMLPVGIVAILIGVFATTVFNPASTALKEQSSALMGRLDDMEARSQPQPKKEAKTAPAVATPQDQVVNDSDWTIWLRQTGVDGASIIGAKSSINRGLSLVDVTAFLFAKDGGLARRIDAATADYVDGEWVFHKAVVMEPHSRPAPVAETRIATDLRADQVRQRLADPDTVSFWSLPELIEISKSAGVPGDPYEMQYQSLLAQPLMFLAMVLVAATVSLRFSRSRDLGQMILTGVAVGFMLYVVTELARGLGRSGVVSPMFAAWTPAVVAILLSVTVLLHREDG